MRSIVLTAVVAVSFSTAPMLAQGRGQGGQKPQSPAAESSSHRVSDKEIVVIREYFRDHGIKPKPLPPGIAKNLARGKPLPPGIARTRMPGDLLTRLTARPDYQWVMAGNVVVLVDPVGVVVDLLREVF